MESMAHFTSPSFENAWQRLRRFLQRHRRKPKCFKCKTRKTVRVAEKWDGLDAKHFRCEQCGTLIGEDA